MQELLKLTIFAIALIKISEANFKFFKTNNDELQIVWTRLQSTINDCVIRVKGLDIMSQKFTIERKLSLIDHVKIPMNILQPGSNVGACLTCQRRIKYLDNPHCENYVVKPLPIINARCKNEKDSIRFEFDHPRDGQFDRFEIDIDPAEYSSLPRIVSKNVDHITFPRLKPGNTYKIIARTMIGQEEVGFSDPVELICKTKDETDVQAKTLPLQSRSNIQEEEMLLMIQSQTAIMKMVIMMTFVVLLILIMSTFTLNYLLRLKKQQVIMNIKRDCEYGHLEQYKKLKDFQ